MKDGNWVPIDKGAVIYLPHGRSYTKLEALFSYRVDVDNNTEKSLNWYSKQWGWSRNKVRAFTEDLRTGEGHQKDRRGTGKGQAIFLKINNLEDQKDSKRTGRGQQKDRRGTASINPNTNPNPKPKPKDKKESSFSFEDIWEKYPNKDGKKQAIKSFSASVKTDQDWRDINIALNNYLGSKNVLKGFIKNGSTWFNNWRDWVDWSEPTMGQSKINPVNLKLLEKYQ